MKRRVCLFLLFTTLLAGYSNHAEAQFWKKWFKKEEQRKPAPKKKVPKEKPVVKEKPTRKRHDIDYPPSVYKERYRVDVLVPLYLNELVKNDRPVFKGKIPEKAIPGLDFYEGVKLAADTLSNFLYSIDVYVHDITDTAETPNALIRKKVLEESDLIIGAVPSQQIVGMAQFAQKHRVNFISALSPADGGVKDNPYFTLLQPSLQSHCEWIMNAVFKKYKKNNPVIFYRTAPAPDANAYNYLQADEDAGMKKVLCNGQLKEQQLKPLFDSNRVNVIVMSILDYSYAESILLQLNKWFPAYQFEVYGMPTWKAMPSLKKPAAYPNIAVYITAPFHFDQTTPWGQAIANNYKKEAGSSKPNEMVYRGYEAMCWYAYLLTKYGTVFNDKLDDNGSAPFTRYEVKPKWDKQDNLLYLENRHIYLYRYQSSSYIVEQ